MITRKKKTAIRKGQPDASTFNLYPVLGQIAVQFLQDPRDFVSQWFFPVVRVQEPSGKYPVFARSHWARNQMEKRSDGERSAGGGFEIAYQTFLCEVFSEHTKQGRMVRRGQKIIDLDTAAVQFLSEQAMLSQEVDFFAAYFKAGVWGDMTGVVATPDEDAGEFLSWADDDAFPLRDMKRAIRRGHVNGGKRFNKGIFTEDVWDVFSEHPNVVGKINNGQTSGMAEVTLDQVAKYLRLEGGIRVASAVETTSEEGVAEASATFDYVGASGVLLGHVTNAPSKMQPSAGYNFCWETYLDGAANEFGAAFRRWFEDGPGAYFYEVEQARDMHQVAPDLAMFLASPLVTA